MQDFYRKALKALIMLLVVDALLACLCVYLSYVTAPLLPAGQSVLPWRLVPEPLRADGTPSTVHLRDATRTLNYDFRIRDEWGYGYAAADLYFLDAKGASTLVDLTKYDAVELVARCHPANSLMMLIPTFDAQRSKRDNLLTYPAPATYFPCNEAGVHSVLSLARLSIPQWWFDMLKLDLTHQGYRLDHVPKMVFATSSQSPHDVDSHVEISALALSGRDFRYIVGLAIILVASVAGFVAWFFIAYSRALTANLKTQLKRDLPLVAYRQLTLEPYRDKEKAAVLRYIAVNYADPELDLDAVAEQTGVNRNKINDVLKAELGLTFSSYLKKLRLTEAARLLAEGSSATIGEIAYSVGYANVSYFNKLFKDEYGCPPTVFRNMAVQRADSG